MISRDEIRERMHVYDSNGERLGRVIAIGEDTFHIEKGVIFPKDFLARIEDVRERQENNLYLSRSKESLLMGLEGGDTRERAARPEEETLSISVRAEEVETYKRPVVGEEIRVAKERLTEAQEEVAEPVGHEEARVRTQAEESEEGAARVGMPGSEDTVKRE